MLGGGGADFAARPRNPTAVLVTRRFLFDLRGRSVRVHRPSLNNTTKTSYGRNKPVTNGVKPNDCGNHEKTYGPSPAETSTRPRRPPL